MNEQHSPEWYAARLGHATASRAGDILATIKSGEAAGRRNYRAQLVVERLTGQREDVFENDAMRWGTEHEAAARSAYCDRTGAWPSQLGFVEHPTVAWAGCSVDGELEDGASGIEVKCPMSAGHIAALLNGMDPKHMPQIAFQQWVMGWAFTDFISFDPRLPPKLQLYVQRVPRNQVYIDALELEIIKFLKEVADAVTKLEAYQ